MSEDLRTDHANLESPSILTKNSFFARPLGGLVLFTYFYFCTVPEWLGAVVVICLERGADLHIAQLMPLPLTVSCFSKIRIGLPFWFWLTRIVPDKGLLNGRVCVCVCVRARARVRACVSCVRACVCTVPVLNRLVGRSWSIVEHE